MMRLKNKKTGEIGNLQPYGDDGLIWVWIGNISEPEYRYTSLAELNSEWEDVPEEPKEYWYLENNGEVVKTTYEGNLYEEKMQEIGNYFETEEEAKKAVEKLKAWKRLKDKGFKFERWLLGGEYGNTITFSDYIEYNDETRADLDLLFGGEE